MTEEDFFKATAAMKVLVSEVLLIDNPLASAAHNTGARILRHGLSVSSFALLEQYLQLALRNFMPEASKTVVAYSDMPDGFRKFVSISAANGLLNRVGFKPKALQLTYFETEAPDIVKFLDNPAQFNWHGFSPKGSNIGKDDIATALKAMGVEQPWVKLTRVTGELGSHRPDLGSDYENLAKTRNTSAHDPTGNVASSDLETNITVANLIAISISLTLKSLEDIYIKVKTARELINKARDPVINVRFLDEDTGGQWLERKTSSGRVIKRYPDLTQGLAQAKSRKGTAAIVLRDASGIPLRIS